MKVVYICYLGNLNSIGITKKVVHKVQTLNAIGCETHGLFFFDSESIAVPNEDKIEFIKVDGLNQLLNRDPDEGYRRLYAEIQGALENVDYTKILLRYPLANAYLNDFLAKHGSHTVLEHNTKEEEELRMYLANITWRDKLYLLRKGQLARLKKPKYDLQNEIRFKKQVLQKCLGGIAVTDEIGTYQKQLVDDNYRTCTISNGTNVDKIPQKKSSPFDGSSLELIMVNSSPTPWHGVDRLLRGLVNNRHKRPIHVHIVGKVMPDLEKNIQQMGLTPEITLHGHQTGTVLNDLFDKAHLAIGTLALHRLNLSQGCVLKVREYMSRGIPFIVGYADVDLIHEPEINNHCMMVPADESAVDMEELWQFATDIYKDGHEPGALRKIAKQTIDTEVKMKSLKDFLYSID